MNKLRNICKGWVKKCQLDATWEDIFQEAQLRLVEHPKPPHVNLEQHMVFLITSVARTWQKDSHRHPIGCRVAMDHTEYIQSPDEVQEQDTLQQDERDQMIQTVLDTLRENDQLALRGQYFDGKSTSILAKEWGIPERTARKRIQIARGRFAKALAGHFPLMNDSALATALRCEEGGNMWNVKLTGARTPLDGWYKTEQESAQAVFVEASGEVIPILDQVQQLRNRCQLARLQRVHSSVRPCSK